MLSETLAVEDFLRKGLFDIPDYQRNYSWGPTHVNELIDDILYLPEESEHFLGNIIIDEHDNRFTSESGHRPRMFDLVDGQQRISTILMLLKVAADLNDGIATGLEADNILSPVDSRPRLLPLGDDEIFFRDRIMAETGSSFDTSTPSQESMLQVFDQIKDRLTDLENDGKLIDLVDSLRYETKINSIELTEDFEAAVIFEGINNRGLDLSDLDKTKSFLMYMHQRAGGHEDDTRIRDWFGRVYRHLYVLENGHDSVTNFTEESVLQFHHGIYSGYDTDMYSQPFDELRNYLQDSYRTGQVENVKETTLDYAEELLLASEAFENLFRPAQRETTIKNELDPILSLARLANVLPVMMAAEMTYEAERRIARVIDLCETLAFRVYAIDRRRADTGQGRLVRLAHNIRHGDSKFEEVEESLIDIIRYYTDDNRFRRKLQDPEFEDTIASQDIRYLLYHYGRQLDIEIDEEINGDLGSILSRDFTVEHILATELDVDAIPDDLRDDFESNVDRLGNLTIAKREWNSKYGNLPFDEKKTSPSQGEAGYASSNLRVQRVLSDIDDFHRSAMDQREKNIIDFALENWSLPSKDSGLMDLVE